MALTPKNAKLPLTTTLADVYTCPTATSAIVLNIQIANIDGTNDANVSVAWTDSSDSDTATYLIKNAIVGAGQAIPALVEKIVLETGDKIRAIASVDGDLECTVAIMQIT